MKILQPIRDKDEYSKQIDKQLLEKIYAILFQPLFDLLGINKRVVVNSKNDLKQAIRSGKLIYVDGYFYGPFNATVSKALRALGATFDNTKKAFKIDLSQLPMDIRTDIYIGKAIVEGKHKEILKHLDKMKEQSLALDLSKQLDTILGSLNIQTKKTLPSDLEVPAVMDQSVADKLKEDYHKNMELYINDFKDEEIEKLRRKVEENAYAGYRADRLSKIIQAEYGVSRAKSTFLAKQETSLLVSKYRKFRYEDVGITKYKWSTSHDYRVRSRHKELDGKVFRFSDPPITDELGNKNNPGCDFGCRCIAIPVIEESLHAK